MKWPTNKRTVNHRPKEKLQRQPRAGRYSGIVFRPASIRFLRGSRNYQGSRVTVLGERREPPRDDSSISPTVQRPRTTARYPPSRTNYNAPRTITTVTTERPRSRTTSTTSSTFANFSRPLLPDQRSRRRTTVRGFVVHGWNERNRKRNVEANEATGEKKKLRDSGNFLRAMFYFAKRERWKS